VKVVAREWLCKHVSTETKPSDHSNKHTHNNTRTFGSNVSVAAVRANVIDIIDTGYRLEKPQFSTRNTKYLAYIIY
jgi:hypothetical protein